MGLLWERIKIVLILLDPNILFYFIRTKLSRSHRHTNVSTLSNDIKDRIKIQELARDNLQEFVDTVPDECLIDLSEKIYLQKS